MRRLRSTLRLPADPLLKAGVLAMAFALVLVGIVAGVAVFTAPVEPAAAVRSSAKATAEPLTRSNPGVDPWVEESVPPASPEQQSTPEPEAQAESRLANTREREVGTALEEIQKIAASRLEDLIFEEEGGRR